MIKKHLRLISWLVTFAMLCSLAVYFSLSAVAAESIEISSAAEFIEKVGANRHGSYILTDDLDFNQIQNEAPLWSYEEPFMGIFDGDGHTIKNYKYASSENYVGLFRFSGGTIKNLTLDQSCSISGNAYVGAIVGQNNGKIFDCISYAQVSCNAVSAGGQYSFMSQNLWSGGELNYIQKTDAAQYNPAVGSPRMSGMLTRINNANPDILALQEVTMAGFADTFTVGGQQKEVAAWNTYFWGESNNGTLSSKYTLIASDAHNDRGSSIKECVQLAYKPEKFNLLTAPATVNDQPYNGVFSGNLHFESGRNAAFAVLQSKSHTNEIILAYSVHFADATCEADARVLQAHIDALYDTLKSVYPSARIFVAAAGDYHNYGVVGDAVDRHLDEATGIADIGDAGMNLFCQNGDEDAEQNLLTIDTADASPMRTVDYIMVNTDQMEVNKSSVVNDRVNGYHPSNHGALLINFEALSGNQFGGVTGRNSGEISRVICKSEMSTEGAEQVGEVIGANKGGSAKAVFSPDGKKAMGGTSTNIVGVESLTASPTLEIIWKMMEASDSKETSRYRMVKGEYKILSAKELGKTDGDYRLPARIGINGVYYYDYVGGVFNLDITGIPEPKYLVEDGKIVPLENTEFIVEGDMNVAVATSIRNVELASELGVKYYTIDNAEELMLAHQNLNSFNSLAVTIFLTGDVDLQGVAFPGFRGNIYFSFDGQGHTISNWNAPVSSGNGVVGFFSGLSGATDAIALGYRGYFIKNVNFDNIHIRDGYGRSVVVGLACGNNDFLMENVHLTNCSATATGGGNLAGLLYTHNNNPTKKHVTIRNCSAIDCGIYSTAGDFTNSGVISGRLGNGVDYTISDIYVSNFINESNSKVPITPDNGSTTNGNGFLIGTIEGSTVKLENIGIFNSRHRIRGTENAAAGYELIGRYISGTVYAEDILMMGNTADAIYSTQGNRKLNGSENIYSELATAHHILRSLTSGEAIYESETTTADHSGMVQIQGETTPEIAAYKVNSGLENASIYWMSEGDSIHPGIYEEQIRKVIIHYPKDADSDGIYDSTQPVTIYANGSILDEEDRETSLVPLDPALVPQKEGNPDYSAAYIASGNGHILSDAGLVVVSNDKDTVVGFITENDGNAYRVVQLLGYFAERDPNFYENSATLRALIEEAQKKLADGTYVSDSAVAKEMADDLEAYKTKFYTGAFDAARIPEASASNIALYGVGPIGYIIMNPDQLLAVKAAEATFSASQTIYLGADLDLAEKANQFPGFGANAKFSFDGQNHTIENWKFGYTAPEQYTQTHAVGLFVKSQTDNIKNVTIKNADLEGGTTTSFIYASHQDDANVDGVLTIENVHVVGSKAICNNEQTAAIICGSQSGRSGYVIDYCTVTDSSIGFDAGVASGASKNYASAFIARHTVNADLSITNCFLDHFDILNAGDSVGLIAGPMEHGVNDASGKPMYIKNVGAIDCNVAAEVDVGVVASRLAGSSVHVNNVYLSNCAATTKGVINSAAQSAQTDCRSTKKTYLFYGNMDVTWFNLKNLYLDDSEWSMSNFRYNTNVGLDESKMASTDKFITTEQVKNGYLAYQLSEIAETTDGYYYWTKDNESGRPIFGSLGNRTLKLTVKLQNGDTVDTLYADGGETVELIYQGAENETFTVTEGDALVNDGNKVRMGSTGQDVVVTAKTDDLLVITYPSAASIDQAVTEGDYTIADATEWMYVYSNYKTLFDNHNITMHLIGDIDLSENVAKNFKGFLDSQFSLDGHGYTIKNWGTSIAPISAKGIFAPTYSSGSGTGAVGAGLLFLKNFNVENCHASGSGALVYGAHHDNIGNANLPETFTMENVHVRNSSMKTSGEGGAILLPRYGRYGGTATVTIKNCSVVSSILDANNSAHKGLIMGKLRAGNGDGAATNYYISDIYLSDNKIINAKDNAGLIFGCIENSNAVAYVSNVGAINNSIEQMASASGGLPKEAALICSFNTGRLNMSNSFFSGNRLDAEGNYLLASMDNQTAVGRATLSNLYFDNTNLTGWVDNNTATPVNEHAGVEQRAAAEFIGGKIPYTVNLALDQLQEEPSFWWANHAGVAAPAEQGKSAGKLTVQNENGATFKELYPNGGESVDLPGDASYTKVSGNVTMSGNIAKMGALSAGNRDAVVKSTVALSDSNKYVSSVTSSLENAGQVDYWIENIAEWIYVYQHSGQIKGEANYFSYPNVTLHLAADIDLSTAFNFIGFSNVQFNFDGEGHTIRNWGSKVAPIHTRGLFQVIHAPHIYENDTANPHYQGKMMRSLRNFTVENFYLQNQEQGSSIVLGFYAGTLLDGTYGPVSGLPDSFTMENVHVKNSEMGTNPALKTTTQQRDQGVLMAAYYGASAATIKIQNCSIDGVKMDMTPGSSGYHAGNIPFDYVGGVIGRIQGGENGSAIYFVMADLYINDLDIINAPANSGLVFGALESKKTSGVSGDKMLNLYLYNTGVFNSSLQMKDQNAEAALWGNQNDAAATAGSTGYGNCYLQVRACIASKNTLGTTGKRFLVGSSHSYIGPSSINSSNIIDEYALSISDLNGNATVAKGRGDKYISFVPFKDSDYETDNAADIMPKNAYSDQQWNYHQKDFAHGYAAFFNNNGMQHVERDAYNEVSFEAAFYSAAQRKLFWTVDAETGNIIPTTNGNRTRKAVFELRDGAETPVAAPVQISSGYTNSEKQVIDDGLAEAVFSMYEWRKADSSVYTETTPIAKADTEQENNRVAIIWSPAVFPDSLEEALEYWNGKDIERYFDAPETIQSYRDLMEERIRDDYYQKQEAAVAGLGFASMAKDLALVKSFYGTYQAANADASNVPNAADPNYQDAPHFIIANYEDLKAVDDHSTNGDYAVGTDIYLKCDLDLDSAEFKAVYPSVNFDGFNEATFNFIGIQTDGKNPVIRDWRYNAGTATIALLKSPKGNVFKNFSMENIHFSGGNYCSFVCGTYNTVVGTGRMVFDNIHIENSTITTNRTSGYEQTAFLLSNLQAGRQGVDISNCSFKACNTEGQNNNNSVLIGRLVETDQTINISNILVEDVEISSYGRSNTLLLGVVEAARTKANIENVGIFNSKVSALGSGDIRENSNASSATYLLTAVAASCADSSLSIKNVLMVNNQQITKANQSAYPQLANAVVAYEAADRVRLSLENCFIDSEHESRCEGAYVKLANWKDYGIQIEEETEGILDQFDANGDGEKEMLAPIDFKSGKAAWIANQAQLAIGDSDGETWLVDESFNSYPTLFEGAYLDYPNQVILTNETEETAKLDDYYTNSQFALPEAAKTFMDTYNWIHDESESLPWYEVGNGGNTYSSATNFTNAVVGADNTISLAVQGVICVDVTWGDLRFTYDYGTWNPHELRYEGRGWNLNADYDNTISLYNNGNVYTEVALQYSVAEGKEDVYTGVTGQFYDGEENELGASTVVAMNSKTAGDTRAFKFEGVPEWDWELNQTITIGQITVAINT